MVVGVAQMSDNNAMEDFEQRWTRNALLLVLVMLLSTTAANLVSASTSRSYTTETDPVDVALGDFDCDGDLDIVTANDRSTKISILWNENGQFQKRDQMFGLQVIQVQMQITKITLTLNK